MRKVCQFRLNSLFSTQNSPLIIGVCVGIAISLVVTPFLQSSCIKFSTHLSDGIRLSNIRNIRSNNLGDPEEDFEPSLNLNENIEINKNGDDEKHASKLIRPRYYSTELGMKGKVLISVISTKESISSFGVALNKTLNHYVDKLIFFLDGTGSKKLGLHIPIVGFKEYKPLIKIFRVLSYLNENYIQDYNYFMFVTDHTYINGKRLMSMLEKISVSQNVHMGILQDNEDSLYCNLDSGIILSQSILEAVAKELLWCTKHSFSDLDSDNFGRCILHASNLPCKSMYQDEIFHSHVLQDGDQELSSFRDKTDLTNSNLEEAVTVRNIKRPIDVFLLYGYYLQEFVLRMKKEILYLREEIGETMKFSPLNISFSWPVGSPNSHISPTRHDLILWETFNATHIFMPNDFENVRPLSGVDLHDVMNVTEASVTHLKAKSSKPLSFKTLRYGHRRYDPTRGMDYLLSLAFTDRNDKIVYKRIEAYRGLTQPEIIPMPYVTESVRVNILLFIETKEASQAVDFVSRLEQKVKLEQITLIFHLMYNKGDSYLSKDDPYKNLKEILKKFTKSHYNTESRATFTHLTVPDGRPSDFALIDLAVKKLPADSLVFVTELKSVFDTDFVNRIRMNAIKKWQVFSPIPFILYHPDLVEDYASYSKLEVKSKNGHFDKYYFNQISFYVEDYVQARKSILKNVPIFRSEKDLTNDRKVYDLTVYEMFLSVTSMHVLRGVEPSLVIHYTRINCPVNQLSNSSENLFCEARQSLSLGQRSTLSKLVYEFGRMKANKRSKG